MRPRPIIGVAITTMALVGGCTVKPVPTATFTSAPPPTTTPAPGPVKYASASFRSCPEIQQKVPGLPPALKAEPTRSSDEFGLTCTFITSEGGGSVLMINFDVALYENRPDSAGVERAKLAFSNSTQTGAEKDASVNLGSDARWLDPGVGPSCRLQTLDANVVLMTRYSRSKEVDPRSEECRSEARVVAKQLFDAIQP
ncbi:hypothetical protein [Lentzea kentuckyensis]|uniref:hypothetical protein n=1 Tax=Lentzea kentuckyensis TaxID=360086 RepID=UPI001179F939|nr:hypothetical protein [Lentzea kentuckyensis]